MVTTRQNEQHPLRGSDDVSFELKITAGKYILTQQQSIFGIGAAAAMASYG